jgi:hypothetical protein
MELGILVTDDFVIKQIWHKTLFIAGVAMIMLSILATMIYMQGAYTYNNAQKALENQDLVQAVAYYEKTIRWYLPFDRRIETAVHKLWEIGQQAEKQGDKELAWRVYSRLRSSLYAIQSVYVPHQDWIIRCNTKIRAITDFGFKGTKNPSRRTPQTSVNQTLPKAPWSFMMITGFWGWIFTTIGMIRYGIEGQKIRMAASTFRWVGSMMGFYCIWMISLAKA